MEGDRSPEVRAFLRVLDPADDATGGGTASAVAGAMAAGLAGMVARLSAGREGMEPEAWYREIAAEAERLTSQLFVGGTEDAEAFDSVRAAFRLPRGSEAERAARSRAIQEAMRGAARVPLDNAERCARVLDLAARLVGRSNPNASSDLTCALELARAGLVGCLANVEINLPSIAEETERASLTERVKELRDRSGG